MAKQKVLIGMPCLRGEMKAHTALSLVASVLECKEAGIDVVPYIWVNDSILPCARNCIFGMFCAGDFTDLVYWDDDIALDSGGLRMLLKHDADFVGAAAPMRSEKLKFLFRPLPGPLKPERGLYEVEKVGTALLRIRRAAAKIMIERYADREYKPDNTELVQKAWCLFEFAWNGHAVYGEDYVFCDRWRATGGKIWIDPFIRITHVGIREYGPISLYDFLSHAEAA